MGRDRQSGQAAVETIAVAGVLALVSLAGWQVVLAAHAWQTAHAAARVAARAGMVGAPVERAALTVLPGRLATRATVTRVDRGSGAGAIRVSVEIPAVLGRTAGRVAGDGEMPR